MPSGQTGVKIWAFQKTDMVIRVAPGKISDDPKEYTKIWVKIPVKSTRTFLNFSMSGKSFDLNNVKDMQQFKDLIFALTTTKKVISGYDPSILEDDPEYGVQQEQEQEQTEDEKNE